VAALRGRRRLIAASTGSPPSTPTPPPRTTTQGLHSPHARLACAALQAAPTSKVRAQLCASPGAHDSGDLSMRGGEADAFPTLGDGFLSTATCVSAATLARPHGAAARDLAARRVRVASPRRAAAGSGAGTGPRRDSPSTLPLDLGVERASRKGARPRQQSADGARRPTDSPRAHARGRQTAVPHGTGQHHTGSTRLGWAGAGAPASLDSVSLNRSRMPAEQACLQHGISPVTSIMKHSAGTG